MGAGRTAEDAAINADIIESWLDVVTDATVCGDYEPIGEADEFDMEYWSLEQAKIDKASVKPLQGQIVVVTGRGRYWRGYRQGVFVIRGRTRGTRY